MDLSLDKKLIGFKQIAQEKLQHILCNIPGKKDLIIESTLIKPLEYVCGASWLRLKGIEKIYKFDKLIIPPKKRIFIYFISSQLITFKTILDHIHSYERQHLATHDINLSIKKYHIILFPTLIHVFDNLLEEEGLHGVVELHKFSWDWIVLDTNVVSLEIPNIFAHLWYKYDTSMLSSIAHSLRIFNLVMKKPNIIFTYGENSEKIIKMEERISGAKHTNTDDDSNADFSLMFILDRNKDFPSTLLTPVVYSGLLTEIFDANAGILQVEPETNKIKVGKLKFLPEKKTEKTSSSKDITHLKMNSEADTIFNENKYRHFSDVVSLLSGEAKSLGIEGKYTKDMKLEEMNDFVTKKLPKVTAKKKELCKHLIVCETIVNELGGNFERLKQIEESMILNTNKKQILSYIDECLSTDAQQFNSLRLMCLLHTTIGVSTEEATNFIKNYCNAFGYQHLNVFHFLSKAKLFPNIDSNMRGIVLAKNLALSKFYNQFQTDANRLKLIPNLSDGQLEVKNPICSSYVFNGTYIPFIAQFANILLKAQSFEDVTTKLGTIEQLKVSMSRGSTDKTKSDLKSIKDLSALIKRGDQADLFPLKVKTLFIFIVGGITYAEIAACSLIEKYTGGKIVLGSNEIITGYDLMRSAFK